MEGKWDGVWVYNRGASVRTIREHFTESLLCPPPPPPPHPSPCLPLGFWQVSTETHKLDDSFVQSVKLGVCRGVDFVLEQEGIGIEVSARATRSEEKTIRAGRIWRRVGEGWGDWEEEREVE